MDLGGLYDSIISEADDDHIDDDNNSCPICDKNELKEEKNAFVCQECGYMIDRLTTGNAKYGISSGVNIHVSGEYAAQYRKFIMKDGNRDPNITRRDIILAKYKQRNYLNKDELPARVIDDATSQYFAATSVKTFRAGKAGQIMSAVLSSSCRRHGIYKTDAEISTFMGLRCKGISVGRILLGRLALENNEIIIPDNINVVEEVCNAVMEKLGINVNETDCRAIIAMVETTYKKHIEVSYTMLARVLGIIMFYGNNVVFGSRINGITITKQYLHEKCGMSETTIEKSYQAFSKYKSHLIRAILAVQ